MGGAHINTVPLPSPFSGVDNDNNGVYLLFHFFISGTKVQSQLKRKNQNNKNRGSQIKYNLQHGFGLLSTLVWAEIKLKDQCLYNINN